jgi:hypothetical protein
MTHLTRTRWTPLVALLAAALLAGCNLSMGDDDDSSLLTHPCADEWLIPPDANVIVAAADADAGGAGTLNDPAAGLTEALELARQRDAGYVVLNDGVYEAPGDEVAYRLTAGDDDLVIVGCSVDTVLQAVDVGGQRQSVFEIAGDVGGLELRNLTVQGGRRAVRVRDGAGSSLPIRLNNIRVTESQRLGISIHDVGTRAILTGVTVDDVVPDSDGALGYGISVVDAAGVSIAGGVVNEATRAGVLIDGTQVQIVSLMVMVTRQQDGFLGHGLHLQNNATGSLDGLTVVLNSGAGVFLYRTGGVSVVDSTIGPTGLSDIEGTPGAVSGAGLIATSNTFVGDPGEARPITLTGNLFEGNTRLGALIEGLGIEGTLDANVFTDNFIPDEETFPVADALYFQRGATATVVSGEPAVELTAELEQELPRQELPVDSD